MQIGPNLKTFNSDGGYRVIMVLFYFSTFLVFFIKHKNFRNWMTVAQGLPVMVFPVRALNLFILEAGQMGLRGHPVGEYMAGRAAADGQS